MFDQPKRIYVSVLMSSPQQIFVLRNCCAPEIECRQEYYALERVADWHSAPVPGYHELLEDCKGSYPTTDVLVTRFTLGTVGA
jgi:hypothetical protein